MGNCKSAYDMILASLELSPSYPLWDSMRNVSRKEINTQTVTYST